MNSSDDAGFAHDIATLSAAKQQSCSLDAILAAEGERGSGLNVPQLGLTAVPGLGQLRVLSGGAGFGVGLLEFEEMRLDA